VCLCAGLPSGAGRHVVWQSFPTGLRAYLLTAQQWHFVWSRTEIRRAICHPVKVQYHPFLSRQDRSKTSYGSRIVGISLGTLRLSRIIGLRFIPIRKNLENIPHLRGCESPPTPSQLFIAGVRVEPFLESRDFTNCLIRC
jgi:hypothetical protein